MALLSVRNLTLSDTVEPGDTPVASLSLDFPDRSLALLVGDPACGHSTLLRRIAGLDQHADGEILLGDKPIHPLLPHQRELAFVASTAPLYPHLTVRKNFAFALHRRGIAQGEIDRRIAAALAEFGLTTLIDLHPHVLAPADRVRAALARAWVLQPKLLLLDHPFEQLPSTEAATLRRSLLQWHLDRPVTLLMATSDPAEAMVLGEQITFLHQGRFLQSGNRSTLYHQPAHRLVATRLGVPPINLLPGTLRCIKKKRMFVEEGQGGIQLPLPPAWQNLAIPEEAPLQLGIRPEALRPFEPGDSSEPGTDAAPAPLQFPLLLDLVESTGSQTTLHLHSGAHRLLALFAGGADEWKAGRRIRLTCPPEALLLFDAATGERIATPPVTP